MSFGPFFSQHVQSLPAKTQRARRLQPVREEMNWRWRAVPLALVAAIVVLVLAGRLWQLQVVEGDQNLASSRNNSLSLEMIPAPRGIIYDRDGKILARNEPSFRVTITYSQLPTDNSKRNAMVARLAKLLSMKKEEVELAIDESMMRPFLPAPTKHEQ